MFLLGGGAFTMWLLIRAHNHSTCVPLQVGGSVPMSVSNGNVWWEGWSIYTVLRSTVDVAAYARMEIQ